MLLLRVWLTKPVFGHCDARTHPQRTNISTTYESTQTNPNKNAFANRTNINAHTITYTPKSRQPSRDAMRSARPQSHIIAYIYIYDGRGCLVRLCQEAIKRGGSEPAGLVNRQIPRFELSCSVRVGLTTKKLNSLIRRTAALFFESAVQLYVLTRKKIKH